MPIAPEGFKVEQYATGLTEPRKIVTAPNGDLFFTEKKSGELKVARGYKDGKPESISLFANGLDRPWGILFYPANNPQWVYVGNAGSMVRFPYKAGDLKASGAAQKMADLPIKQGPGDFHDTRDLALSKDGKSIYVSVGSGSNIDDPDKVPAEKNRAAVHEYTVDGKFVGIYASGIRNPVGLGVHPTTGEVWVSVNERDNLGDNLVPEYVTSVKKGGFYGCPYYYIGGNIDARLGEPHPELKDKVIVPDVLIQPHSASLGFTWYTGTAFPAPYRGDLFVAEHGSWNRANRSGAMVAQAERIACTWGCVATMGSPACMRSMPCMRMRRRWITRRSKRPRPPPTATAPSSPQFCSRPALMDEACDALRTEIQLFPDSSYAIELIQQVERALSAVSIQES